MKDPPRDPKERIVGRPQWIWIAVIGMLLTSALILSQILLGFRNGKTACRGLPG